MAALIGKTLGPYEITAALGAGGMGEVYRARDTRLGREVAIKVLPENLANDPNFKERFDREARTISQLAHAHICTLYDVGHQDGIHYLVMELLEGETLGDRLAKGPLPSDQVLKLGVQLADALGFAHRHGVIHRDLKPGNVMLTKSGVKLMDFGLAKESLAKSAMGASAMTAMVTQSKPLTTEGTLVGTFQYMAPEQLEGGEADQRTDIFSLGVVLYEMATSKRAFTGKTQASVIASILASEPPPISSLQPMTPPALDRVIRGCMAKDPDDRIQTAHDLKMQLQWIVEAGSQANIPAPLAEKRKMRARLGWVVAGFAAVAMFVAGYFLRPQTETPTILTSINLPPKLALGSDGSLRISPDGKYLVFAGAGEGQTRLWIRPMNSDTARSLEGTDDAFYPFWSADSKWVAFFAAGHLKKVQVEGGPVQTVADAPDGRGGSWSKDGVILFAPEPFSPIFKVSAAGGTPVPVTVAKSPLSNRWPAFLPDGHHFLYFSGKQVDPENSLRMGDIEKDAAKNDIVLLKTDSAAQYASGVLLYVKNETLMAQPFDGKNPPTAEAIPLAEHVQYNSFRWMGNYSASDNGLLVYRSLGSTKNQLTWLDRDGRDLGKLGDPAPVREVAISPDASKALGIEIDPQNHSGSVYLYDVKSGNRQKVSFEPGRPVSPLWSRDGSEFEYTMVNEGKANVYLKSAQGTEGSRLVYSGSPELRVTYLTEDGRMLFEAHSAQTQKSEIYSKSLKSDEKPTLLLGSPDQNFVGPSLSENGKWLVYNNDLTHSFETYVVPYPPSPGNQGARWQVSANGSSGASFVNHDTEIVYVASDNRIMSVSVNAGGPTLGISATKVLLQGRTIDEFDGGTFTTDGQRLLVSLRPMSAGVPVTVVTNWTSLIKK